MGFVLIYLDCRNINVADVGLYAKSLQDQMSQNYDKNVKTLIIPVLRETTVEFHSLRYTKDEEK